MAHARTPRPLIFNQPTSVGSGLDTGAVHAKMRAMAQRSRAYPDNVPGPLFVDASCIDCGTCYGMAPALFREAGDHSAVHRQPGDAAERHRALMALLACPTGSIGTDDKAGIEAAAAAFPEPLGDGVFFCGYTSSRSYGAWSYFVPREDGNLLVDSPRAFPGLLDRLEAQGGVALLVLSHKDDVADHARLRARFGCARVLHEADLEPDTAGVELPQRGLEPRALGPDLLYIPTPGHTAGSACLLLREEVLFTGDTLWWSPARGRLDASREHCWHDWATQMASLERLRTFRFRRILPGHGRAWAADTPGAMRRELDRALAALAGPS